MMKYSALTYAVRRALITGRNSNCQGSAVVSPLVAAETTHLCAGGGNGNGSFFYWKRMMASQPMPSLPSAGEAEAKSPRKEKESSRTEAGKSNNNMIVSSYWGISRPKIKREDGTEWPWNCFMVRIRILIMNMKNLYQFLCID